MNKSYGEDDQEPALTLEMALTAEGLKRLVEEYKKDAIDPIWLISPKTCHQMQRLGALVRRNHRAWLRKKRQRRARQRRHNRGLA